MIELTISQGDKHRLVLLFHQPADGLGQRSFADVLRVRRLRRLENTATVREKMRDDVRMADARIFRLDMEDTPLVLDIVVEAENRRRSFHETRRDRRRSGTLERPYTTTGYGDATNSPRASPHCPTGSGPHPFMTDSARSHQAEPGAQALAPELAIPAILAQSRH